MDSIMTTPATNTNTRNDTTTRRRNSRRTTSTRRGNTVAQASRTTGTTAAASPTRTTIAATPTAATPTTNDEIVTVVNTTATVSNNVSLPSQSLPLPVEADLAATVAVSDNNNNSRNSYGNLGHRNGRRRHHDSTRQSNNCNNTNIERNHDNDSSNDANNNHDNNDNDSNYDNDNSRNTNNTNTTTSGAASNNGSHSRPSTSRANRGSDENRLTNSTNNNSNKKEGSSSIATEAKITAATNNNMHVAVALQNKTANRIAMDNMNRNDEIINCTRAMNEMRQKMNLLLKEQRQMNIIASLLCQPSSSSTTSLLPSTIQVWKSLPRKEKFRKDILLILFYKNASIHNYSYLYSNNYFINSNGRERLLVPCSNLFTSTKKKSYYSQLPNALQEDNYERSLPKKMKQDRDIFLARISTKEFRFYYINCCYKTASMITEAVQTKPKLTTKTTVDNSSNNDDDENYTMCQGNDDILPPKLIIPNKFWFDIEIVKRLIHNFPEILLFLKSPHLITTATAPLSTSTNDAADRGNDDNGKKKKNRNKGTMTNTLSSSPSSTTDRAIDQDSNNTYLFPIHYWDDPEIFMSVMQSPYPCKHCNFNNHRNLILVRIMEKFHPQIIRQNKQYMLLAMKNTNGYCFSIIDPTLRDDKRFILQAFEQSVTSTPPCKSKSMPTSKLLNSNDNNSHDFLSINLSYCSRRLRDDIDVVLAAVSKNGSALQYASKSLRRHYRVIMTACTNDPTAIVFALPSDAYNKLRSKKSFWIHTIFQKLIDDYYPCIQRNMNNRYHHNNRHSSGLYGRFYNIDEEMDEHVLRDDHDDDDAINKEGIFHLRRLWDHVGRDIKDKPDVVIAAIKAGCLPITKISNKLKNNQDFWIRIIQYNSQYWFNLPHSYQKDIKFVMDGIRRFYNDDLIKVIFKRFESLKYNRTIWLRIIRSIQLLNNYTATTAATTTTQFSPSSSLVLNNDANGNYNSNTVNGTITPFVSSGVDTSMHSVGDEVRFGSSDSNVSLDSGMRTSCLEDILAMAPISILSDKEIMLEACLRDYNVYCLLHHPLDEDRDIVEATLRSSPGEGLNVVEAPIQLRYPDLVANAIRAIPSDDDVFEYFDSIADELWSTSRDVALAWVSRGGDYLHDGFPVDYENDPDIFLHVAKHNPHDFWCASEQLCGNKEYMKKIVEINGQLLCEAWSGLSKDFDLATIAFASTPDLPIQYDMNDPDDFLFITSFAKQIRLELQEHTNFQTLFLCAMSVSSPSASRGQSMANSKMNNRSNRCNLPLLDQGKETAMAYKLLIADYIGIPRGKYLQQLRQASMNLATWGY